MEEKKYKILIACTHSFGAKFLVGQLRYLKSSGFDVYVISAPGLEIEELCMAENASLIPFAFSRSINPISDALNVFKVYKIVKRLNPDIINAGTPKAGLIVVLAGKFAGIYPTLFTLRGLRSETLTGLKGIVVRAMEKLTCMAADRVIPISKSLAERAIELKILDRAKSILVGKGSSNGVNIQHFSKDEDVNFGAITRSELGIRHDDCVIGYIGRINKDKGIPELFNTFLQLTEKHTSVKLLLVGKFELEDAVPNELKLEMLNHPSVVFVDYLDDIVKIYNILDVLVLFSKREGFGNIIVEASSMRVPVIASDIPGCRDAVSHGQSGFLVRDELDLRDKLETYINMPNLRRKHGDYGRKWVAENFSSEYVWSEQVAFYKTLLNSKDH